MTPRKIVNGGSGFRGFAGVWGFLGLSLLGILVTLAFSAIRPPTVDEVERDIWRDWARATVDDQGENIAGLVDRGLSDACQRLIAGFGQSVQDQGDDFVLRTKVRSIRVLTKHGDVFASWESDVPFEEGGSPWRNLDLPLSPDGRRDVGRLQVSYKFNESTLESLPNIQRLAELHNAARWLVGVAAALLLVAAFLHAQRIRERAARLQSQQVTLDLARQMCHELRNGLWAFSLEGRNLRQLFELFDSYFRVEQKAMRDAAATIGMSARDTERFLRQVQSSLADAQVDPVTDLVPANAMARESHRQIESFSKYIHLTVEQLDRNLLGNSSNWELSRFRVSDVWREACELLELRFHSAGVERRDTIETDQDWIVGDRRSLAHAFVNLAKNAIEAMLESPSGRCLSFQVRRSKGEVSCRVENPGRPIPAAALPHIFERGFSTKVGAGRGIGLALVKDSIDRMNGRIEVIPSESGASFVIYFPAAPDN